MAKRIGKYTIQMENMPSIEGYASVCGKKEAEGPLGKFFDQTFDDTTLGESSWEKAESKLQTKAVNLAIEKSNISSKDIESSSGETAIAIEATDTKSIHMPKTLLLCWRYARSCAKLRRE